VKLARPQSLNAQFALAVLALAILILGSGAMAVYALSTSAASTEQLAQERLTRLQDAQDLLQRALLVERKALQLMNTGPRDSGYPIFVEIVTHLEAFDGLVDRLAGAAGTDNVDVLDLRRSSQLLRNTANIAAQVHENALKSRPGPPQAERADVQVMNRLHEELQQQAEELAAAARQQSTHFTSDYREAVQRLVEQSTRMRTWVVGLVMLSLLFTWLIAHIFLKRQIVARLQEVSRYLRRTDDDSARVTVPVQGADEIADMARAVEQFLEDRRHLKETERQLTAARDVAIAARKAQATFLANMSHELRTPLNAILGYAQLLEQDDTLTTRQANGLSTIHQSGTHLLSLINDLLDLSRIEANKLELHPETVTLQSFLRAIADTIEIRAHEKKLSFQIQLSPGLPTAVRVDAQRLQQVLLNLLGNAVKFTDAGGILLRVQAIHGDDIVSTLRFEVEDTGIGIAANQLEKIFQPFEQVGDVNRRAGGTGLGLAISRQIVRMMGSDVRVESRQLHEGATHGSKFWFDLALPIVPASGVALPRPRSVTGYDGARKKVLVVDDVVENRALAVELLGPLGFAMFEAEDGLQGLDQAQALKPDLILMDVLMPKMDGLEAMRRLRQMSGLKEVPIIAISASASGTDAAQSLTAGADAFLAKPVNFDQLVQKIGELLKLTWQYESPKKGPLETGVESAPLIPPPPEELQILHRMARVGSMRDIRERAIHLAALDPRYRVFADKLRRLAEAFQSKAILGLVEEHIERVKSDGTGS